MRSLIVTFAVVGLIAGVLYGRVRRARAHDVYQVAEERLQAERVRGHLDTDTAELVRIAIHLVRDRDNGQGPSVIHVSSGTLRVLSGAPTPGCTSLDMRPWLDRELTVERCP